MRRLTYIADLLIGDLVMIKTSYRDIKRGPFILN
jgi:hypothetical protein